MNIYNNESSLHLSLCHAEKNISTFFFLMEVGAHKGISA